MIIDIKLDEYSVMPIKAHDSDAGFDLTIPEDFNALKACVPFKNIHVIDTHVHINIPEGFVGIIKPRSSTCLNNIWIFEGVIDAGFTGSIKIMCKLLNKYINPMEVLIPNTRIAQLLIMPIAQNITFKQVETMQDTPRGERGLGSSGK